jgi:hypothetical protein
MELDKDSKLFAGQPPGEVSQNAAFLDQSPDGKINKSNKEESSFVK